MYFFLTAPLLSPFESSIFQNSASTALSERASAADLRSALEDDGILEYVEMSDEVESSSISRSSFV